MSANPQRGVVLSFVAPLYNEQESLPAFYRQLRAVAEKLSESYELIFVNDGSTDDSSAILRELRSQDEHVRYLSFSRNFGKHEALAAGYDVASGQAVITLDADCQHPPEFVTELIAKWREGFDVVYTVRTNTQELRGWKRLCGRLFYRALKRVSGMDLTDCGDFLLLDRKVVEAMREVHEKSRFTRGLIEWLGFKQTHLPYQALARQGGQSGYSFGKLVATAGAALFNFSTLPLRAVAAVGLAMTVASIVYGLIALLLWPFVGASWLLNVIVLAIGLTGLNVTALGVVGEYVGRTFEEARNRPLYVVRDAVGFDMDSEEINRSVPVRRVSPSSSKIRLFT
jgi:dolichol-phosphate mannosyltransferase